MTSTLPRAPGILTRCFINTNEVLWAAELARVAGRNNVGRNKLRTYRQFKAEFTVEPYVQVTLSTARRGALAKFRSGTAPIRLETGRYENLPEASRTCIVSFSTFGGYYVYHLSARCLYIHVVAFVHVTETSEPRGYFPRHGNGRVEPRMDPTRGYLLLAS